tara:strand:+ start:933 stop:1340 length:408 start_codon:yes stop_codon:yes gene_type:complete
MRHLTEYTENGIYVQAQVEELALKMAVELTIPDMVKEGDSIKVANDVATFVFVCTELDGRPGCSANYYKLAKVIKHLSIESGAQIVVDCNFQDAYKQGDIATLTKNEGASGWWGRFPTGVWNVGFGHDFFVIKSA